MRNWLLFVLFGAITLQAFAGEIPQVPHHMEFAGMKLKITESAREEIQKHVNALRASDKYFKIKLDRVNLYFPIIERVFKESKLPDDFKYLAIQESALISDAVSSANAVGFWQFKSFTGREVGLRIDDRVDERLNIVSATRGAAKYMKTNNFYYNNWIYALMAYNTGRGGARKYVDEENYGVSKMTIDKKTHWYVKTFLAHKIAFEDEIGGPHSKGLQLVEYTKGGGKTLAKIAKEFEVDLEELKEYNKWLKRGSVPEDKEYTVIIPVVGKLPKHQRDIIAKKDKTDEDNQNRPVVIKSQSEPKYPATIKEGLENASEIYVKINGIPSMLAKPGDTQESLAAKGSTPLHRFRKFNDLSEDDNILPGHLYYLNPKKWIAKVPFHIAQPNENLWRVSQKYGIRLNRLAKLNRIEIDSELKPGQVIWLRKKRPKHLPIEYRDIDESYVLNPIDYSTIKKSNTATDDTVNEADSLNNNEPIEPPSDIDSTETNVPVVTVNLDDYDIHTVVAKETLYGISKKYGMTVDELIEVNRMDPYNMTIEIDQKLYVKKTTAIQETVKDSISMEPDSVGNVVAAVDTTVQKAQIDSTALSKVTAIDDSAYITHVVLQGESLYGISRKYGVTVEEILSWNGLTMESGLDIDQQLKIKKGLQNDNNSTPEPPKEPLNNKDNVHIVAPGDTLYSIARKYDVTVEDLVKWNNKPDTSISIGEELKVSK